MWIGVAILVLLAVNAVAAVVACYRLGAFKSAIDALRGDQRDEMISFRRTADQLANHVLTLEEKVDASHSTAKEMTRLLAGARREQEQDRRRSRPDY